MSERIRARMLLAQMDEDTGPTIVAAVDETIWENWNDGDEAAWMAQGKQTWGIEYDTTFKVVVAEFAPQALVDAFGSPTVEGTVSA